jgi:hypothetical protein
MADNKNTTIVVGLISLVLVGTAVYFVVKALKKPTNRDDNTGNQDDGTKKRKSTVIVEDLINEGIGQPSASWIATQPQLKNQSLGIGEIVSTWLGKFTSGNTFQTKTNLGLGEIKPTEIKTINVKKEISDSLKMGYNPNIKKYGSLK